MIRINASFYLMIGLCFLAFGNSLYKPVALIQTDLTTISSVAISPINDNIAVGTNGPVIVYDSEGNQITVYS